jgi:HEAT repeat protein
MLDDDDDRVRRAAAAALEVIGPPAKEDAGIFERLWLENESSPVSMRCAIIQQSRNLGVPS